jgi:integrase/recombinase XerD
MITIDITDAKRMKITTSQNAAYYKKIGSIHKASWIEGEQCWDMPYSDHHLDRLVSVVKRENIILTPGMRDRLILDFTRCLHPLHAEMAFRRYRPNTIRMYMHHNLQLLLHAIKFPGFITIHDVRSYLNDPASFTKKAPATRQMVMKSLKFYYGRLLKKKFFSEVSGTKRDDMFSDVLSREEVAKIFFLTLSITHQAMLRLAYSSGLRASEVVKLRPADIDFERKIIFVRGVKGRKDRYAICSNAAIETLAIYIYSTRPKAWLFPGRRKDSPISIRTVENIFARTTASAGITRRVTFRILRQSFAIHLLENGVDMSRIREILGAKRGGVKDIDSRESPRESMGIVNPLDSIIDNKYP